jgi:predicted peptidase
VPIGFAWLSALCGRLLLVFLLSGVPLSIGAAHPIETGFLNRTVTTAGKTYRYQVFVPFEYEPGRLWPVILFLHGAGERGADGIQPTEIGLGTAIRRHVDRYPAIVVFPQGRSEGWWEGTDADLALTILQHVEREFRTDLNRVYLTGLSSGGAGAYYLASRNPGRFAAVIVASANLPRIQTESDSVQALAHRLRDVPLWIFHGDADTVAPVEQARRLVAALTGLGSEVRYSELPGVGHNAWDAAYQSAEVILWLFSQRRTEQTW